ncbi:histone deacetylase complex protein [Pholiota molesta]|nr:histone deacetylase complex protein [Pholiota molesta]
MDIDESPPIPQFSVSREKTAPFLIRTFVKIGSFHRLSLFEDGTLPTTDEHQIFTWKDATLREVLTTLRNTAPHIAEYRHPLARFSFKTVFADSTNKGRYAQKDIGTVYSRDILGEPGSLASPAPRLTQDTEQPARDGERNLDDLRFIPGDFLLVAVLLPKSVTLPSELAVKGAGALSAAPAAGAGWRTGGGGAAPAGKSDGGWGRGASGTGPGFGRGGGHWRGGSDAPARGGRGGGGRGGDLGRDRDRDRDRDADRNDSRVPPPRRSVSPPPRSGGGWGARGGRGGGGGGRRSPSRSRSPPRRRNRYD